VDPKPGFRRGLRARVGQLNRTACRDDASVASLRNHSPNCVEVDQLGSQHGVKISYRIRQCAVE
jgi:hypothetical protein